MGTAVLPWPFLNHADMGDQRPLAPEFRPEMKHDGRRLHHERGRGFVSEIQAELHPNSRTGTYNGAGEAAEHGAMKMSA